MSEQPQEQNAELTYVYRFFDKDDTLIYVGVTRNLGTRFKHHEKEKDWFHLVARTDATPYRTRASAFAAEATAILTEAPTHNRAIPTMARHDLLHARADQDPDAALSILERVKTAERIIGQFGVQKREIAFLEASNARLTRASRDAEESAFTSRSKLVSLAQAVKDAARANADHQMRIADLERENARLREENKPAPQPESTPRSFWLRPARRLSAVA